jgi:hypothetical protein
MVFAIVVENKKTTEKPYIRAFQVTHQCLGMLKINNPSTSYPHTTFTYCVLRLAISTCPLTVALSSLSHSLPIF